MLAGWSRQALGMPRHARFPQQPFGVTVSIAAMLLACIAITGSGCGKKGDPLPPLRDIPLPTRDLEVRQQGRQILLDMAYPTTTVSGMTLGGIDAVELLELVKPVPPGWQPAPFPPAVAMSEEPAPMTADEGEEAAPMPPEVAEGEEAVAMPGEGEEATPVPPESAESEKRIPLPSAEPREFEAAARTLLTLRGSELTAAVVGDRIQIRLPLAEPLAAEPLANIFAVRTIKGDETSMISNRVTLVPIEPPSPPRNLQVRPTADGIELTWEAESDALGFEVFRRDARVRGYDGMSLRLDGTKRQLLDPTARFGERYIYTVRTIAGVAPLIYSDEAGEREVEYEDRFAPPLPQNLVALAERAAIRLRWQPSTAEDVAGYVIYRREPGRDFHRLTGEPVTGAEYFDRGLSSGLTYAYRLQVIDLEGNESELSEPVETTAR